MSQSKLDLPFYLRETHHKRILEVGVSTQLQQDKTITQVVSDWKEASGIVISCLHPFNRNR